MNDMTIGERIRYLRKKNAMTQTDIAKKLNIATQTVFKYEKNIVTSIPMDNIEKLAELFDVTPAYLMGWEDTENQQTMLPPQITENVTVYPVIGEIAAGYDNIALETWSGDTVEIPNSYIKGHRKDEFIVLCVKGDSMYPIYQDGDKVLILRQATLNNSGDVGAVIYGDETATIKKVEYVQGEDWLRLVPLNPLYKPLTIAGVDLEHCRVIGIPKMLIREIK